jgi:hypothetical protein
MKIEKYFLIVAIILIIGCKSPNNGIYEFDPRIIDGDEFTLSEIADSIIYIPLDNNHPLDRITRIKLTKDKTYLNSRNIGILAFDRQGKLLSRIGSIGRGPGEYRYYLFFCIDEKSGRVYNIADQNEIIQVFSGTGQFIRSFSLKEYGTSILSIEFYNSQLFVQCAINYPEAKFEWIIYDTLGNVIKKQNRHLPLFSTNYGSNENPYMFDNKVSYYNTWTDTVFSVLPDYTEKPSLIISPGEHREPQSNLSIEQIMQKKHLSILRIFETKRFIVIKYFYLKYTLALIDKNTHSTFLIDYDYDDSGGNPVSGIENDIDGGSWFLPESYFTESGREYMVGIQYPYQIKARVASEEFKNSTPNLPEEKKALEKLAHSMKETDNPVLMIVRLKK